MTPSDLRALRKQARLHSNEVAEVDGVSMPKSAAMLLSVLATEPDEDARLELYGDAISECSLAGYTAVAVKLAQAKHEEFCDDTSLITLSYALFWNNEPEAALLRAKEALEWAIREQAGINNAAGHLVRMSVKTGSVEAVNEALEALIDSAEVPRTGDCVLDTDWCDKAQALGADMEIISWVRSVGKAQLKRSRRRKARRALRSRARDSQRRG